MANQKVTLLASHHSHMPFLTTLQHSGTTQKYGFDLEVDVVGGVRTNKMEDRSKMLLDGTVDFVSGLHHEPYFARAEGEKRFVYLAQAQNNWDDRLVVSPDIKEIADLKGKRIIIYSRAPCVAGNLLTILESSGVSRNDLDIQFPEGDGARNPKYCKELVNQVLDDSADATLVDLPYDLYATKRGLHILELPDRPVIHNTTILTTTDYIQAHESTVEAFLKAMVEALHFFKTKKEETLAILKESLSESLALESEDETFSLWDPRRSSYF